jgi:hypothetical protein
MLKGAGPALALFFSFSGCDLCDESVNIRVLINLCFQILLRQTLFEGFVFFAILKEIRDICNGNRDV